MQSRDQEPLPLHLLTGFLGSGKTELLRGVLARTDERVGVLVNEVGDLPIDRQLLEEVDEGVLALPGGCVCCVLRGDLHDAVQRLRAAGPQRIVLETTGLADPAPIAATVGNDERLRRSLFLAGIVTVVDCLRADALFAAHEEFRRQLDFADRIVLTKTDLANERAEAVRSWVAERAPGREIVTAGGAPVDADWLFAPRRFTEGGGDLQWLHGGTGHHHVEFSTHAVRSEHPVDVDALQLWLRLVTQVDGERLLRVKALARCAATGDVQVLQSAGRSVSPPRSLTGPGSAVGGAEVVLIERGMPAGAMRALLASLYSALGVAR